jgi:hypothetical protein
MENAGRITTTYSYKMWSGCEGIEPDDLLFVGAMELRV